ncbi:hypothetical protein GW17_00045331, partial [Ensete ventricosum]
MTLMDSKVLMIMKLCYNSDSTMMVQQSVEVRNRFWQGRELTAKEEVEGNHLKVPEEGRPRVASKWVHRNKGKELEKEA